MIAKLKKCKTCGIWFTPTVKHRDYCSDECADKGKRKNYKNRIVVCENCGTEFRRRAPTQKYCCAFCRNQATGIFADCEILAIKTKKKHKSTLAQKQALALKYGISYGIVSMFFDADDIAGLKDYIKFLKRG